MTALLLLLLMPFIAVFSDVGPPSSPPETPPAQVAGQQQVRVGVYVLSISQFSTATGSYVVDLYLTMECDKECGPRNFEFMNGRATAIEILDDDPNYKSWRIQASLFTDPDVRSYPFDQHHLKILFEDKNRSLDHLVYVSDPGLNGVDPQVIIAGWQLVSWDSKVVEHVYPTFDAVYSCYEFDVVIERGALSSIFKSILPALFIVLGGFLSLLLGPDKALQRLGINTGALIGGIMFHVNLTSQLPPVGYLTLADKFMIVNYIGLVGTLAATVVLLMWTTAASGGSTVAAEKLQRANWLHRMTAIALPLVWAVGQAFVFLLR